LRLTRPLQLVALLALGMSLSACGGSSGGDTTAAATTASATPTPVATTAPPTATPPPTTAATPRPTAIVVKVVDGKPQGGIVRRSVSKGDRVVLVVHSDTADEIHLHGYDLSRDVDAGGTVRIPFVADTPGRFEVELENLGVQIAELTVS